MRLIVFILLAGCISSGTQDEALGPPDGHIQAPDYQIGQWWDIHLVHERTGNAMDLRRVVAGETEADWLMGMPADSFLDYVMIVHFPAMGEVSKDGLSFDAHDEEVRWLDFPLYEGKQWSTLFYWSPQAMTLEVTSVEGGLAKVEGEGLRDVIIWYNASMGTPEWVHIDGYLDYRVTAHGTDHEGDVMVPIRQDLVFYEGRTSGQGNADLSPGIEEIEVPLSGYDRASFALLLYEGYVLDDKGGAHIEATATAPDGTTFTATNDATHRGNVFEAFGHSPVDGTWRFDATVAGTGSALLEGIAYQVRILSP